MTMTSPVTALASRIAFVTTNTASPTSALYTVKPLEAATWPTNSQRETPSLDPSRHCLCTCFASVATRIAELSHPTSSVTREGRPSAAGAATICARAGCGAHSRLSSLPAPRDRLLALPLVLLLVATPEPPDDARAPGAAREGSVRATTVPSPVGFESVNEPAPRYTPNSTARAVRSPRERARGAAGPDPAGS